MMKTEYAEKGGCLQRDSVEHKEYAEAYSTERQEVDRKDGAYLLEKVLDRDNLNKAYKRVNRKATPCLRISAWTKLAMSASSGANSCFGR